MESHESEIPPSETAAPPRTGSRPRASSDVGTGLPFTQSFASHKFKTLLQQARRVAPELAAEEAVQSHLDSDSFSVRAATHAVAGASGALLAMAIVYPLDNLRTRISVNSRRKVSGIFAATYEVLRVEGWYGLYRGLHSALIGVLVSWGVYYYLYTLAKLYIRQRRGGRYRSLDNLLVGIGAGIASTIVSNPLWVANTRMKLQRVSSNNGTSKQNVIGVLRSIARNEGIGALFSGVGPSLMLTINPAIQFTLYESMKEAIVSVRQVAKAAKRNKRTCTQISNLLQA
eukprot:GHVT01087406.1.p1 GENE.GHVT01087406.1~~GHVT01087406.1.p1  ORF type:complete len:286 (+),score=6.62 GHVT01087406.1:1398-2255(+)